MASTVVNFEYEWAGLEWVVKQDLEKLDFVRWDRYTESGSDLNLYGWIKREDTHEDFVLLTYQQLNDTNEYRLTAYTSSSKYSETISQLLFDKVENHVDCKRIEYVFNDLSNVIKLGGKSE